MTKDDAAALWPKVAPWLVVLFALGVRLYYFALTRQQPVWWDEAEYLLKAKSYALGTPATGFFDGRPIGMPLLMSLVYAVGLGEQTIRVGILGSGVAAAYLLYRVGERLFDATSAFVAACVFGISFACLFFSTRVMTELPHTALCLLGTHLLLEQEKWSVRLAGPVLVAAIFIRYTSGMIVILLGLYVLTTEGLAASRRRDYWVSVALSAALATPFFIRDWVSLGHPLSSWRASAFLMPELAFGDRLQGVLYYCEHTNIFGPTLGIAAIGGIAWALIELRMLFQTATEARRAGARSLLLVLWLVLPFVYFGGFVRPMEPRYVILALAPLCLFMGSIVARLAAAASKLHGALGPMLLALALLVSVPEMLRHADAAIRAALGSYGEVRDAALWVAEHSPADAVICSTSPPQVTYYSERATLPLPRRRELFEAQRQSAPPRFVVLSSFETTPRWVNAAAPRPEGRSPRNTRGSSLVLLYSAPHQQALGLQPVAAFPSTQPRSAVFVLR